VEREEMGDANPSVSLVCVKLEGDSGVVIKEEEEDEGVKTVLC